MDEMVHDGGQIKIYSRDENLPEKAVKVVRVRNCSADNASQIEFILYKDNSIVVVVEDEECGSYARASLGKMLPKVIKALKK